MICEICGNPINQIICPHCNSKNDLEFYSRSIEIIKTIYLKDNRKSVLEAIINVETEISRAYIEGTKIIKFVHGYGSTGVGGKIKIALRNRIKKINKGKIIEGEYFYSKNEKIKNILNDFKILKNDIDYNKKNKGITLFILK